MRRRIIISCLFGSLVLAALVFAIWPKRTVRVIGTLSERDVAEIKTLCTDDLQRWMLADVVGAFERRSFRPLPRSLLRQYKYHLRSIERTSVTNAIAWIASGTEIKWGYVLEQTNGVWSIVLRGFEPSPTTNANLRSALDVRTGLSFKIGAHWPGASESER